MQESTHDPRTFPVPKHRFPKVRQPGNHCCNFCACRSQLTIHIAFALPKGCRAPSQKQGYPLPTQKNGPCGDGASLIHRNIERLEQRSGRPLTVIRSFGRTNPVPASPLTTPFAASACTFRICPVILRHIAAYCNFRYICGARIIIVIVRVIVKDIIRLTAGAPVKYAPVPVSQALPMYRSFPHLRYSFESPAHRSQLLSQRTALQSKRGTNFALPKSDKTACPCHSGAHLWIP